MGPPGGQNAIEISAVEDGVKGFLHACAYLLDETKQGGKGRVHAGTVRMAVCFVGWEGTAGNPLRKMQKHQKCEKGKEGGRKKVFLLMLGCPCKGVMLLKRHGLGGDPTSFCVIWDVVADKSFAAQQHSCCFWGYAPIGRHSSFQC